MSAKCMLLLTVCFIGYRSVESQTHCHVQNSPSTSIFRYISSTSGILFGYITMNDLQPGDHIDVEVTLSIAAYLKSKFKGHIQLAESLTEASNNIAMYKPVHLWVMFPIQNPPPVVVSISQNGQTICTGHNHINSLTTVRLKYNSYPCQEAKTTKPIGVRISAQTSMPITTTRRPTIAKTKATVMSRSYEDILMDYALEQNEIHLSTTAKTTIESASTNPLTTQRQTSSTAISTTEPTTTILPTSKHRTSTAIKTTSGTTTSTVKPTKNQVDQTSKCGQSNRKLLNRLFINGAQTERGQFPWAVPLFDCSDSNEPVYICGSTIVSTNHLITAAHCVEKAKPNHILAVPGMYNIDDFNDPRAVLAPVESITSHEDYTGEEDFNDHDADIAILRLKKSLEFSDYISPICLWRGSTDFSEIVGQEGLVSGWGFTEAGPSSTPYHTTSIIVGRQECIDNQGHHISRMARVFCGNGNGTVPCNGDSGSGLVMKRGKRYFLRGIVSTGLRDPETLLCDTKKYVLYTDVARFSFWIRSNMVENR